MSVVRKLLFALQADWYHGELVNNLMEVLHITVEMMFSKEDTWPSSELVIISIVRVCALHTELRFSMVIIFALSFPYQALVSSQRSVDGIDVRGLDFFHIDGKSLF